MASDGEDENDEALETYTFIPEHLRHHLKYNSLEPIVGNEDNQEECELVRHARKTRSAHLVAELFSQSPPAPTQMLYSEAIERTITARMTFYRALEDLETYFTQVTATVKQLETLYPNGIFAKTEVKIPTLVQVQRHIVNTCQGCLNDCDLYLGMYEALPSPPTVSPTPIIRFVACSTKSSMLSKRLECPRQARDQPQEPGNQQQIPKCITMQAMTAKEAILVDDIADLEPNEIHRFASNSSTGPFSCFPLVTPDSRTIGVLSVDSCRKAHRLLPQSMSVEALSAFLLRMQLQDAALELKKMKMDGAHFLALTEVELRHKPTFQRLKVTTRQKLLELVRALQRGSRIHLPDGNRAIPFTQDDMAVEFLDGVSKLAGPFLTNYRRVHWIQEIANVTRNAKCTAYDVYDVLIRAVTQSMEPLERVSVWKITKKAGTPTQWEVDVVASTSVPDDRLVPFLDGQERKMKRISLYKENEEAVRSSLESGRNTPLIRGGIVNITTEPDNSATVPFCENAKYQISWADRTLQAVSWPQLRQFLPIRNMNAKHFQLRQLCSQIEANEKVFKVTSPNGIVLVLRDSSRPEPVKYALQVDFTTQFESPQEQQNFLDRAVSAAEQAIACVRGREARHALRKRVVAKNAHKFQSIGLNPSGDALRALHDITHQVFQDIVEILPGVHVQIAELQADGAQLKYTFASKNSTALGCSLSRGQGVSFVCLETKIPIVVNATSEFKSRLQRIGAFRNQPQSVVAAFPFLFLPLFHEDCCVGVLSLDSFQSVPKGRKDETHPEAGVLEFLIPLAKLLASAIYAKRRSFALYELLLNCQKPLRSPQQLLFYACRALKDVVIGAWKVRVVEIDGFKGKTTLVYDFSEAERELAQSWTVCVVRPMAFHWKELCTDTIMTHLRQLQPGEEPSPESVIKLIAAIREDEKERQQTMERFQELIAQEKKKPAVEAEKTKLLEKQIADNYFFLLPDEGQVVNDRITSEKYITHALKQFLGTTTCLYSDIHAMARLSSKLFLTITALPPFYAKCDQIYLQRVTSITSKYFTALQGRVRRSSDRVAALIEFRDLCQKVLINDEISPIVAVGGRYRHKLLPSKEIEKECLLELQRDAIALIERVLKFPNVYFGMWEPALRILRYTSASKYSRMAGKKLKHGHGVSFSSMEKQVPIVITTRDAADDEVDSSFRKLRYFTNEPPVDRKWPFIVVPVGKIGVLALDNMHTYEEDSHELQPELGVVDFLRKIGQSFAQVITVIRERTALQRQQLREDAIVRVMSACENFKPTSNTPGTVSMYLPHLVLQQVENAFNGVDAYIGLADPLCERIRFICASSRSKMEKKTVNTTQSLSFRVFASQRTIVIPQLSQYFKEQELLQQRDSEHGQKLKYFGGLNPPQGPFVCVPIPFVGILSVDTFPGAAGGVFSSGFPEDGVVALLEKAANYLGENIRTLAATDARKLLPTLFRGTRTSFQVLFHEILHIISRNLLATTELQALRYARNGSGKRAKQEPLASMKRSTNETQHDGDEELYLTQCVEEQLGRNMEIPNKFSIQQLVKYPEIQIVYCSPTRDVKDDTAALLPTILVLRRVKGAVWEYDKEFLLSILPLINSLIALVNVRVQGIVGRRLAIRKIDELCSSLGSYPSSEALEMMYSEILPTAMDTIAQAMSLDNCDAYLGQRERTDKAVSVLSHLQLRFVAASSQSLMSGVALDLDNIENFQLQVVQCLQNQQIVTVILSRDNSLVRALTTKPAQRIFLAVPMGDNYVLCADSLGQEAFIPGKNQIEPDIILFFKAAASKLHETILSTRHRFSYDQLMSLSLRSHTDFRLFQWTILEGLRRDLVNIHSQQILTLGADFTSAFRLEAWQRFSTRRPLKTLPDHFCSVTRCEREKITHEIHSEDEVYLPMTNLPRTLDLCRSRMHPVEGTEKHGSFTCACMATMLDSSVKDAKLALCVFSHDAKARDAREMPTSRQSMIPRDYGDSTAFFSNYQRQYFFAFAAVASTVYTHVFRACALETFATELFVTLQEYLDAKEGLVVRFSPSSTESMSLMETAILFSQQPGKSPPGRAVQGKLEKKIRQFEESEVPVAIFMTKKALVAPPTADFKVRSKAKASEEKPEKRKERFFQFKGKKLFRFGKKKKQDEEEKKAREQQLLLEAVPELQALSPSRAQQLRHERISLNIFVRGLDFQDRHDMIYFTVEKQSLAAATSVEKLIHQVKARAEALATEIQSKTPQGNEEINAKRFCSQSKRGGGGFLVISLLEKAREGFQLVEGALGGAMRQFLTGAQSTARDNKSENLSSLFSEDSTLTPAIALLRVTLVACAVKRETVLALSQGDLFKEYLRLQAGRKLLQLEPTDKKTWGAIGRARTLLRNFNEAIHTLDPRLEEGNEPVGVKAEANQALYALLDLLLTQSAVVRYLNQLEAEISRERKRFYDDPAIVLQCFVRQTQARMELKKRRAEFHAALAIQCAFRQHLARRRLLFMKWNQAAITVQRAYRRKRQRAKGTKPRRFTVQLLSASQSISKSSPVVGTDSLNGAWKTDMAAFGTFQEYLGSKMGREQLKKEEELMWKHRQELEKERAKLPRAEALREDVGDLFELLDDSGSGELSRERTANLITRLHVPLNDEEVADVVAMMDNDGSGAISMDEFMRWFVHEFPVLQKRAPKVCGVVTRKDWQWVIQQSARSAILKRWRALRAGNIATAPGGASIATKVQDSIILEEDHESEENEEK